MYDTELPGLVTGFMKAMCNVKPVLNLDYPIKNPTKANAFALASTITDFLDDVKYNHGIDIPTDRMAISTGIAFLIWGSARRKRYYIPSGPIQDYIDQIECSGVTGDLVSGFADSDFECGSIVPEVGTTLHYAYVPWIKQRLDPNDEYFEDEQPTGSILLTNRYGMVLIEPSLEVDFLMEMVEDDRSADLLLSFLQFIQYRKQYPEAIHPGLPKCLRNKFKSKKVKQTHSILKLGKDIPNI